MNITHPRTRVPYLQINDPSLEAGYLKIYGKNATVLQLGDATHEGGDVKVYRDGSNNLQLSLDADAASNAKALDVYGGIVAQNYLTVGQTSLNTTYVLYVNGYMSTDALYTTSGGFIALGTGGIVNRGTNQAALLLDITVSGTDSTDHAIKLEIDASSIIEVKATGDGAGGITNKAIGLYGGMPATQHAAIADATDAATAITQLNLLLAANRAISLIAT